MALFQALFFDFHLDKYFNTSNTKSQFTRGIIVTGGPLEGYQNTDKDYEEQNNSWCHMRISSLICC